MHIERTPQEDREELERQLRAIQLKIEVKTHVKEYATEKVSHYLTLTERLSVDLRELETTRADLELRIKETRFHVVKRRIIPELPEDSMVKLADGRLVPNVEP